jgi:Protein of unknown function (DUF4232)
VHILARPPASSDQNELEALIREARARQRRRWMGTAALVASVAGTAVGIHALLAGLGAPTRSGQDGPRPLASVPRCNTEQLRASWRFNGAYTSHSITSFALTNISNARCTLRGWPRLQLVMRNDRVKPGHVYRDHNSRSGFASTVPVQAVLLKPGGAASFNVVVVDQVGRAGPIEKTFCAWSRGLLVTPPGARTPLHVRYSLSDCGLGVSPVVGGRLDRFLPGA